MYMLTNIVNGYVDIYKYFNNRGAIALVNSFAA